jgi:TBC1 domain family protein 5
MHELLAPVLWVVAHDAVDKASLDDASPSTINEALLHALDSDFIEHDAFTLFCAIMQTAKQFYEQTSEKNPGATQETSAIVSRSHRIHRVVLRGIDADLADHLQVIEILPQIFLT